MSIDTAALKTEIHEVIAAAVPLIPGVPAFADGIIETVADDIADKVVDLIIAKLLLPAPAVVAALKPVAQPESGGGPGSDDPPKK